MHALPIRLGVCLVAAAALLVVPITASGDDRHTNDKGKGHEIGKGKGHGHTPPGPPPGRPPGPPPGRPPVDISPFTLITPEDKIVSFNQVHWDLELAQLGDTNWGNVVIDPERLARKMGNRHVYINVVFSGGGGARPVWAVENLAAPPNPCMEPPRPGAARPTAYPPDPIHRYINLTPGKDHHQGRIPAVEAIVLASDQPVPLIGLLLPAVQKVRAARYPVGRVVENAEGFLPDAELGTRPPRTINPTFPLGIPPSALTPELGPIDDLVFPLCIYQTAAPNIECAKNQCVPMAQANAIQYLDDTYNGGLLIWDLPELPIPGIGRVNSAGDVIFWEPIPPHSVVANVDFFTRRNGVFDFETGSGSDICQLFRGLFGYLTAAGPYTGANVRHQGTNSALIGDGEVCDTITIDLGGRVSVREGVNPTWEWIFDQLQKGRAVTICFGRYDVDGNRTSGHCVRVYGACRFGNTKYLYTLDDGDQGANNVGTRTQVWQVADTGSPGAPGVPDGRLNMDGLSWEIEFANSIEAKPFLAIP